MTGRLASKIALVVGGGRGMGAATCQRFAEAGAAVAVANRTLASAEAVAAQIETSGGRAIALPIDASTAEACRDVVAQTVGALGGLDILVHNAAHIAHETLEQLSEATLDATLQVNLQACFWLTQAAVPHMRRRGGGRIIITSSVTGPRVAFPGLSHYAASKGGVSAFVRSAALELAPDKITVNAVEPGFIAKPDRGLMSSSEARTRIESYIPLGEMGAPDDIAWAMVYLASDEARYVTGHGLVIDGGAGLPESGYAMEKLRQLRKS
ncbi:MAG: SDR family oxidoreductase [Hyphomicrobiaceae bacterium]